MASKINQINTDCFYELTWLLQC